MLLSTWLQFKFYVIIVQLLNSSMLIKSFSIQIAFSILVHDFLTGVRQINCISGNLHWYLHQQYQVECETLLIVISWNYVSLVQWRYWITFCYFKHYAFIFFCTYLLQYKTNSQKGNYNKHVFRSDIIILKYLQHCISTLRSS